MIELIKDKVQDLRDDVSMMHKSLTIWFNAAIAFLAFALPQVVAFLPSLQPYIPEADFNHLMVSALVGNFILRFKTDRALRDK